jgi:DNA-directed RNA polymerase subunit RPC12/RpoP
MIRTSCPKCNATLGLRDSVAGRMTRCPSCRYRFLVATEETHNGPGATESPNAVEQRRGTLWTEVSWGIAFVVAWPPWLVVSALLVLRLLPVPIILAYVFDSGLFVLIWWGIAVFIDRRWGGKGSFLVQFWRRSPERLPAECSECGMYLCDGEQWNEISGDTVQCPHCGIANSRPGADA